MDLSGLKDQIKDQVLTLWTRLQESSIYLNVKEQFDALPLATQRAVLIAGAVLVTLGIFMIPVSYYLASYEQDLVYEENRELLRDLLHIARDAQLPPPLPPEVPVSQLQSQVQMALAPFALLPEQMGAIQPLGANPSPGLVGKRISQTGVSVQLFKLNLRQTLDIGAALQRLSPGLRLMGLEVQPNRSDPRYLDVQFQMVQFSLPASGDTNRSEDGES